MNFARRLSLLFSQGMRIFFLPAGVYAVLSIGLWVWWLASGTPALPFAPPPALWHAHEMIFGYAAAVLGGFFLTAVPSWTGTQAVRSTALALLAGLWLAGRLGVWLSGMLDPRMVAVLELAFLPVLGVKIAAQLVRRPKPQNMMFLGLISILWIADLMVQLDWTGIWPGAAGAGVRMGLAMVCAMIAVIGGRVIPAFTRNAMLREGREDRLPVSRDWADRAGIALPVLLAIAVGGSAPAPFLSALALGAGLAQAVRLAGWRGRWTLGQPILWSLHLAFAMLAAGYLALGAAYLGWLDEIGALHLLGIGAIGGMTLAMMSRAALGHTNRPLVAGAPIAWAYGMIAGAALLRFLGAEIGGTWYLPSALTSGALWLAGFSAFTLVYLPILTGPRLESTA